MFDYMQKHANNRLEANLDNGRYDESQLIELKVAVNLPYQTSWASYQRYDGEIEINGVKYKYVKRKLVNDTLYLKCIPNQKEMALQTAKNDFFKITNDLTKNKNPKKTDNANSVFKNLTVFDGSSFEAEINSQVAANQQWVSFRVECLPSTIQFSPEQPPDYTV